MGADWLTARVIVRRISVRDAVSTWKVRQVERLLEGVSAPHAAKGRSEWVETLRNGGVTKSGARLRVGDFATSWTKSKLLTVDRATGERYIDALESRNDGRAESERVPRLGILGTHKRLQIPRRDEGYSDLYYVRLTDGRFVVEEFRDEV